MKKVLIAIALMPVGYVAGFMLPAIVVIGIEGSVQQVPTPTQRVSKPIGSALIAAKPPIKSAPIEATFAKLEKPQPVSPQAPQYRTREEACQLLGDPEEVQLCVEYPMRETILNSAVNRPPSYRVVPATK